MRGKRKGVLDPVIVPLDLALEGPFLGQVNGGGAHSAMFRIGDDALCELFRGGGRGTGSGRRFSRGGRGASGTGGGSGRYAGDGGRRSIAWVRGEPGGLFAAVGERVFVLLETGHDAAATRLHSRAQLLRIRRASGAHGVERSLTAGQRR